MGGIILRRIWLLRSRYRGLARTGALLCIFFSATMLLNSVLLADSSHTLPRSQADKGASSFPASTFTPQLTQFQSKSSDVEVQLPTQLPLDKDDFFSPYKGKVIERTVPKKERRWEGDNEADTGAKRKAPAKEKEPSFGFVNADFKSPYEVSKDQNSFLETFQNNLQNYGINPGMLLGAVAAVKKKQNANYKVSNDGTAQSQSQINISESNYSTPKENSNIPGDLSTKKNIHVGHPEVNAPTGGAKKTPPKRHPENQGSSQSILGSLMTQFGPAILGGALSQVSNKGRSSGDSQANPLQALVSEVGPNLLRGFLQQGSTHSSKDQGKSSPIQSIMSGLGPMLLAGAVSQGIGGGGRSKDAQSPVQSMISQFGPQLMSNVLQKGLGLHGRTEQDEGPAESILSGIGPILGSIINGDSIQNKGKSPIVSIISGVGKTILNEFSKKGRKPAAEPPHKMSQEGTQEIGLGKEVPQQKRRKGSQPPAPSTSGISNLEGEKAAPQTSQTDADRTSEGTGQKPGVVENNLNPVSQNMIRFLAKGVMGSVIPDRLFVPKPNSTRGVWDMAVNLALGNPKENRGRNSQFWSWMREIGGGGERSGPAPWMERELRNPQRATYADEIASLYDALTNVQPVCQSVATVGGLYNWKKDVLEGSKAVCMDSDVSPKKKDCIVYSFGVKDEWSFEEEMESYGCEVWAFDPTMTTGNHNHSEHIHFYNLGLGDTNVTRKVDGQVWNLFTYPAVVKKLGHSKTTVNYLKLNTGGTEWEVLREIMKDDLHTLTNVRQLGVKVHLDLALKRPDLYKVNFYILRDLESYGFQLFSSRGDETKENIVFDPILKRKISLSYELVFIGI